MRTVLSVLMSVMAAASVIGAASTPERVAATPIPEAATAIRVDGELNDDIWQTVPPITGFRQRDPKEGAPPTFETEARVAYDATALYIAVQAFDPEPKRIVGIRTRRDEGSPSDWIRVIVDSFHDRRSAFEFAVNPAGVKQDTYWFNDNNNDQGWDAVWDVGVSRGGTRLARGVPHSVLAAAVSPVGRRRRSAWRSSARSAG